MTLQKERPLGVLPTLSTGQTSPNPVKAEQSKLTEFLDRYASGKFFQDCVSAYVRGNALCTYFGDLPERLERCGSWLILREYLKTGKIKLAGANFCDCHLLCVLCAAARSRYLLARYIPAIWKPSATAAVHHFMLTLTWPPVVAATSEACDTTAAELDALKSSLGHGETGLRKLWARKKVKGQGPFRDVLGMVSAVEVTRGPSGWHPHFHCVITLPKGILVDVVELRGEWEKLTGGRQIRLDKLKTAGDLVEVFKYAFKPMEAAEGGGVDENGLKWRLLAFLALRGRRLIRSYGCYFNFKPDVLPSEEIALQELEGGAFVEWLARWDRSTRKYYAREF